MWPTSATEEMQRKDGAVSGIIFFYIHQFFSLTLYRRMSLCMKGRQCAKCVKVWMDVSMWMCECAKNKNEKPNEAEMFGWWVVRVYVWVMLTISFTAFLVLICILALLKAVCKCTLRKTNDIWVKSTPHSTLINVWKQQHRLFAQNSFPFSAFFYFLNPYGEQMELPHGPINAIKYV